MPNFVCDFSPVIFSFFGLNLHWYGLMYFLSFFAIFGLGLWQIRLRGLSISRDNFFDLIFWIFICMVIGARLGHFIFYNSAQLFSLEVLRIWHGGMSFHGGLLGVVASAYLLAPKYNLKRLELADLLIVPSALALSLGRIGNFINCELWGRVSDLPWAIIFPRADLLPRHPAQLYGSFLYFAIFVILVLCTRAKWHSGKVFFLGLVLLGLARFCNEFFREPDYFVWGWFTIGQLLSLPVLLAGIIGLLYLKKHHA